MKTKRTIKRSKKAAQLVIICALFFAPFAGYANEDDKLNQKSELSSEEASYSSTHAAEIAENSELEIPLESWMLDVDTYLNDVEEAEIEIEAWMTNPDDPFWAEVNTKANPELAFEIWMANPEKW